MRARSNGGHLALAMTASLAVAGSFTALLLYWENNAAWWQGYKAALAIGAIAALISWVPLRIGMHFGLTILVAAQMFSFLLGTLVFLIAGVAAIRLMGYPALPTFALITVFYLTLLGAEAAYLGVAHWSAKA